MGFERWLIVLRLRIRSLFRRDQVDHELGDELQFHLDERARELTARGLPPATAGDAARRAFGGVEQRKEECRDARRIGWFEDAVTDLQYALRVMRRSPSFTAVAVTSLAIGIGANTAIFSIFDALVLKPLPVVQPEQLRTTNATMTLGAAKKTNDMMPFNMVRDLQADRSVFSETVGFAPLDSPGGTDGGRVLAINSAMTVTANYFSVLGVGTAIGRVFDDCESSEQVVLSSQYWRREFGSDPSVIGRTLTINGRSLTVIGVASQSFYGLSIGRSPDIYVRVTETEPERPFMLRVVGRLQPDVTDAVASERLTAFWLARAQLQPGQPTPTVHTVDLESGLSTVRERLAKPLSILMVMVGVLLLVACANVATMMLSRATARRTEIVIRAAIGAGRARLVRQLATEGLCLVVVAATVGVLFARWATITLVSLIQYLDTAVIVPFAIDWRITAFTLAVAGVAALVTSVAPALHAAGLTKAGLLNDRSDSRLRTSATALGRPFVVAQVALSLTLIVAAGLMLRTLMALTTLDAGFNPERVVMLTLRPENAGYKTADWVPYYERVMERLRREASVEATTLMQFSLFSEGRTTGHFEIPGYTPTSDEDTYMQVYQVGADFFTTLGIPIVEGRDFANGDGAAQPLPVAISETAARRFFGNGPAEGRTVGNGPRAYRISAVVRDGRYNTLRTDAGAVIFLPYTTRPRGQMTMPVKFSRASGANFGIAMQRIINDVRELDPRVPVEGVTLQAELERNLGQERLLATIATFFAGTALLLLSLGLYGVISFWVSERTPEIGVRLALGARRRQVIWDVMRRPLSLLLVGLVIGLGVTLASGRLVETFLFGLAPRDPMTIAAAALALLFVAVVAGTLPARRACRVNPIEALRCE